jgi:hypothetical protein
MLLIAPMDAGITHSRCTFWQYPGEILLIILWMSYFLYPQLVSLPEARENRFSTEERAKFQQGNLKIYIQGLCHHYSLLVEVPSALYHLPHFASVEVYHR